MPENEGGDSKFMTGFLVGFFVGVLICLGVGGTFGVIYSQRESLQARAATEEAMLAREMAEMQRIRAEEAMRKAAEEKLKAEAQNKEKEESQAKEKATRIKLTKVETAAGAYMLTNRDAPEKLETLTEKRNGKPAYLEKDDLLDPWGRPFEYEPGTRNPKNSMPLIYSRGANPGKSPPIRNWQAEEKDK